MMTNDDVKYVLNKFEKAPILNFPFPHFYIEDIFPADVYTELQAFVEAKQDYVVGQRNYKGRTFGNMSDVPHIEFMKEFEFTKTILKCFRKQVETYHRENNLTELKLAYDLRLVRDGKGYSIGPHTDSLWKMVSLLFYLPKTDEFKKHGTSIYLPKDREFRCKGGPHHSFADFTQFEVALFKPNACFGFWKTDNSFHGVEPITEDFQRDVLLFNIYNDSIQR